MDASTAREPVAKRKQETQTALVALLPRVQTILNLYDIGQPLVALELIVDSRVFTLDVAPHQTSVLNCTRLCVLSCSQSLIRDDFEKSSAACTEWPPRFPLVRTLVRLVIPPDWRSL